jgi:hypothetical protein
MAKTSKYAIKSTFPPETRKPTQKSCMGLGIGAAKSSWLRPSRRYQRQKNISRKNWPPKFKHDSNEAYDRKRKTGEPKRQKNRKGNSYRKSTSGKSKSWKSNGEMVLNAIDGMIADFGIADLECYCPMVGRNLIRSVRVEMGFEEVNEAFEGRLKEISEDIRGNFKPAAWSAPPSGGYGGNRDEYLLAAIPTMA